MQTVLVIIVGWIILSCTLGPLLTWAFFYSKRRARVAKELDRRTVPKRAAPVAPGLLNNPSGSLPERHGSFVSHQPSESLIGAK
jgi:hypothetical protein